MPDESALIGGREPLASVVLVAHDPHWAERFEAVEALVRSALGPRALAVEHIGSTAVPGLVAKPVVDVLLTVGDVADEDAYLPALVDAGLELRVREPGHRMLRTPARDVHLHVYEPGRPEVRAHLDFRDRLRADAADRELYAASKRQLATRSWEDMNAYADAKSDVVGEILGRVGAPPGLSALELRTGVALLRRAQPGDLPALVALLADDVLGATRETPAEQARYAAALARIDADPAHLLVVATLTGQVAGTLQLSVLPGLGRGGALRGQLESVHVRADLRGGGLGAAMIGWAVEEARARGCTLVQLTSDKRRPDAHRFYRRLGFTASHEGFKRQL